MRTKKEYNAYMRRYMKTYFATHPKFYHQVLVRGAARRLQTKTVVLTHYGKAGKLRCCWRGCVVQDVDMLSIDHVKDNGARHRSKLTKGKYRGGGGLNFYGWLIRHNFPKGYDTLCHNHQWKKEILRRRSQLMDV